MGPLAEGLLSLSGWAALALLFALPALEAPAFLGLVLPGELALLLGGVLAHQDRVQDQEATSARPGSGPGRPTGTPSGRWDPRVSRSWRPRPRWSRAEPALRREGATDPPAHDEIRAPGPGQSLPAWSED
jgi:hypothetical protein